MNIGLVASLHVHPRIAGGPMQSVESITLEANKGVLEDARYYARKSRIGQPSKRQVSIIEREQLAEHAAVLGLKSIAPGQARSNIETTGIDLQLLVGKQVQIGEAVVFFYEPRTPCEKMDAVCQGLRKLMEDGRQGVMAQVVQSGAVRVGDTIRALS
jgi:MOSC domain-containing protein YiiM